MLVKLLLISVIALIVVIVFFMILDHLLKNSNHKKPATPAVTKSEPKKDSHESIPASPPPNNQTPKSMTIYNSELADDLQKMLQQPNEQEPTRLQVEAHINRESNISKYVKDKNYHTFEFAESTPVTDDDAAEDAQKMTFTAEDYKRIVALSNIDTKK